jgi:hypothetical protein
MSLARRHFQKQIVCPLVAQIVCPLVAFKATSILRLPQKKAGS